MKPHPSSTRWLLATAFGCALLGLALWATAPDYDRPPGPQLANERARPAPRPRATGAIPARAPRDRGVEDRPRANVVARGDGRWLANSPPRAAVESDGAWFAAARPRPAVAVQRVPPPVGVRMRPPDRAATAVPMVEPVPPAPPRRQRRPKFARLRRSAAKQRSEGSTARRSPEPTAILPDAPPSPRPDASDPTTADEVHISDPTPEDEVAVQTGDDVRFGTEEQAAVPVQRDAPPEDGTVSLWVQPGWKKGAHDDATFVQLGDRLRLAKDDDVLRLETAGSEDVADIGVPIADWKRGEWHHVTATWSEDGVSLYVDGELVARREGRGLMELPADSELVVGSDRSKHARVARGVIGRVDVRNRSLGEDEVAAAYGEAIGDRPGRADEAKDRGGADSGYSDEHDRGRSHDDAEAPKTKSAAKAETHHRPHDR